MRPFALVFTGKTKKIAYASQLDGIAVLPVQGITYLLYGAAGLTATVLFLRGQYGASFLVALVVTQGWRVVSEFFRDDHRGSGRLSAYQVMGLVGMAYGAWMVYLFHDDASSLPQLGTGLARLWSPGLVLFLQLLWLAIFLYTGLSRVTAASLRFHVEVDKI
jgi:hypothetical protein